MEHVSWVYDALRERVARGQSLTTVDEELIRPAPVDDEQRAALWLFAWIQVSRREAQRNRW